MGGLLLALGGALLLAEPYTGLDAGLRRDLPELARSVVADREVPAVLVAHELAQAQAFADRLAVLDRGHVLQCGPPGEVVRRPASRRVAELVGYQGFVPAGADGSLAGVHPERVTLGGDPGRGLVLTGRIIACRPAGASWETEIAAAHAGTGAGTGAGTIRILLPDRPAASGGELVITLLDPPCFGRDGVLLAHQVRA